MARPRLIILIRHAQSEGNKNRDIHQTTPDHRVKLTPEGWTQAHEAGRRLRNLLRPDDTLHFYTSPYRRTRETTEGILATLTSDDEEPSPFRRSNIKVYEEPRLREQDFGNFQPCSAEMERMWHERADYGHFFYRIPNGESAADAYDRVSGFNESLWRQFSDDDFASVCVLVTHGLMSRVFLMKWYHFTVEYFEDLRNVDHCEFLIMRKQDNSKYLLETKLRTWSELRKERALAAKDKDRERKQDDTSKDASKLQRSKTFVVQTRWGGCPNGCSHTNHYKKRRELDVATKQEEQEHPDAGSSRGDEASLSEGVYPTTKKQRGHQTINSKGDDDHSAIDDGHPGDDEPTNKIYTPTSETHSITIQPPKTSTKEPLSYLKSTPHLHLGRDFGGTYSGHASIAGSDTDASEDETQRHRRIASLNSRLTMASRDGNSRALHERNYSIDSIDGDPGSGHAPFVNRLGDAPSSEDSGADDADSTTALDKKSKTNSTGNGENHAKLTDTSEAIREDDYAGDDDDDLAAAEAADRSIQGSVY